MSTIWLIPAQDRIQESLGKEAAAPKAMASLLQRLSKLLSKTFPRAQTIMVIDRLDGYSNDPKRHVLRVEVVQDDQSSGHVVKIGPPRRLAQELRGWQQCERPVNERGRVFMALQPGKSAPRGGCESLIYEDAHQTLRAAQLVSFEDAVLGCCRWGTPTTASLQGALDQIFAEMADRLYRRSWSQPPDAGAQRHWRKQIARGFDSWTNLSTPAGQCYDVVLNTMLGKPSFFDPCACVDGILADTAFMPQMQRGCAHGDLHGRNMVVGIVDGHALFPAVFDYEHMGPDNCVGWDFVKLETELKVRALAKIVPGDDRAFMESAYGFEERLARETESRNDGDFAQWADLTQHASDQDRLLAIVLTIRRHARRCLEEIHKQRRRWLHEYYFLLATYGVYAGRFETYRRRDQIACVISAGVAAARYAWSHINLTIPQRVAEAKAHHALAANNPKLRLDAGKVFSHHPEFSYAKIFTRSRRKDFVQAGIKILESLKTRYERSLEIWQELALAYAELHDLTRDEQFWRHSERVLLELEIKCPLPHYETLCRWGRLWKDRGDRAFDDNPDQPLVKACYERALTYYDRAYQQEKHYYPGGNVATLTLLLGRTTLAEQIARDVLASLSKLPQEDNEDAVWSLATAGEARLVLGECEEAARLYQQALWHKRCKPHFRDSMAKQVRRILRVRPCASNDFKKLFDPESMDRS